MASASLPSARAGRGDLTRSSLLTSSRATRSARPSRRSARIGRSRARQRGLAADINATADAAQASAARLRVEFGAAEAKWNEERGMATAFVSELESRLTALQRDRERDKAGFNAAQTALEETVRSTEAALIVRRETNNAAVTQLRTEFSAAEAKWNEERDAAAALVVQLESRFTALQRDRETDQANFSAARTALEKTVRATEAALTLQREPNRAVVTQLRTEFSAAEAKWNEERGALGALVAQLEARLTALRRDREAEQANVIAMRMALDTGLAAGAEREAALRQEATATAGERAAERATHAAEIVRLEERVGDLEMLREPSLAEFEQARARCLRVEKDAARLENELHAVRTRLEAELADVGQRYVQLARTYAATKGTIWWRLTDPLRTLSRRYPGLSAPVKMVLEGVYWAVRLQFIRGMRLRKATRLLADSGLVDPDFYVARHPEVGVAGVDPVTHYLLHGASDGGDPNAWFSTAYYLGQNPDVAAAGVNPLVHYVLHGAKEGRQPGPDFDGEAYLRRYPDVARSGLNPLSHFVLFGRDEGRAPRELPERESAPESIASATSFRSCSVRRAPARR